MRDGSVTQILAADGGLRFAFTTLQGEYAVDAKAITTLAEQLGDDDEEFSSVEDVGGEPRESPAVDDV